MDFFSKNKPVLGVDLGTRTIKGVKLKKDKNGGLRLAGHFFQDLAHSSDQFPANSNRDESFKAAIEVHKLGSSPASTAVPDAEVLTFSFELPEMTAKEMEQAVPQEVAEQSQLPIEEYVCDYVSKQKESNQEIKAYCVKRELIVKQMDMLKSAGLKPKTIETEMMAITAMLEFNDYLNPEEVTLALDLGESRLTSGLIVDGELVLTKTESQSIGLVNRTLQQRFQISYDEAEKIKNQYDFIAVGGGESSEVSQLMDEVFTQLVKTIKDLIDFYRECPESFGRLDRILLVGGGTQIKNIAKIHETFFKIPTTVVNPFRNIEILSQDNPELNDEIVQLAPFMGTAVGLALIPFGAVKKGEQS